MPETCLFVNDERWYHVPGSVREVLTQDLDLSILSNTAISNCLNSANLDCRGRECLYPAS